MARKKKENQVVVKEQQEIKQFEIDWNKIANDVKEAAALIENSKAKPKTNKQKKKVQE